MSLNDSYKMHFFFAFVFLFFLQVHAQWNDWSDAESVKNKLAQAEKLGKTYYSQFDWFSPRKNDSLKTLYSEVSGMQPFIYSLDFYYASGTYFPKAYIQENRKNLVSIVKQAWREYRAIPSFSWHLENPYVPSDFGKKMGCRYRFSKKISDYPNHHRYVIKEILTNVGDSCGLGNLDGADNSIGFLNPRSWFESRVREVAGIINEFVDDNGVAIPIIIRLWHECEDNWMWWGSSSVSAEDYKNFFLLTENLIKQDAPKAQILWAYGPDRFWKKDEFLKWYPGNDYVDIIGYDDYSIGKENVDIEENIKRARYVSKIARENGKIAALFETANRHEESSENFFMGYLLKIMQDENVSFGIVQTWSVGQFSTIGQREDRIEFFKNPHIIMWKP